MKPAVLIASFPQLQMHIELGRNMLDDIKNYFPDADIYIGINPGNNHDKWIEILQTYSLPIVYADVPQHLVVDSDASAYQAALNLYYKSGKEYDLLWFLHFKITAPADSVRAHFYKDRDIIEHSFDDKKIGLYAQHAITYDHTDTLGWNIKNTCHYKKFPCTYLQVMPLYSFYVVRASVIKEFLNTLENDFLNSPLSGDRYFFERDFPQIVFQMGFLPKISEITWVGGVLSNKETFERKIEEWKKINH